MKRRGEILILLLAAFAFAAALRWPVVSLDRGATPDDDALFEPPPAWLLPLDDAYIFVRYAQQAARGRPFQWTDGEPSTGSTSLAYLLLHLPGQWLFDDLAGWSWWASFLGLLSLWALGVAGLRLLRAAGVPDPWPLAAGLALVWCGPIGWVSIAGMDSALGCAALLWVTGSWISACRPESSADGLKAHFVLLVAVGLLPLFRPDFAVVSALAALALVARRGPSVPRWSAAIVLLPGLLLAALDWTLTGHVSPGGVMAKSILPLTLTGLAEVYGVIFRYGLAPVYAGLEGRLLPPPVGWLAAAMAVAVLIRGFPRRRGTEAAEPAAPWRGLFPLALLWLTLVIVAPFSGYLIWQHLRHHHPGLACAWLLAAAALAELVGAARRRGLFAGWRYGQAWALALPFLLLANLHSWAFDYFAETVRFHQNNGKTAEWLAENQRGRELLLHDAGLMAIAHDGPAVDVMGLGTTELARPYRAGLGAVVETLARRSRLPTIAAVWSGVFDVPGLLGPPLFEVPERPDLPPSRCLRVSPILGDGLASTALPGPGLDLAYIPNERRHRLRWTVPPPQNSTYALTLSGADGRPQTQGCRELPEELRLDLPGDVDRVRIRAAARPAPKGPAPGARLRVAVEGEDGRTAGVAEVVISRGSRSWTETEVAVGGGRRLVFVNAGAGVPCLESVAFRAP